MALSSESNKQVFSPTAGQTSFQFTLKYFNSTDIKVEIKLANGSIVPASDFSFTVSAINNNEELGANVVITISPALAVGDVVTIFREVPYTQQYDLQPGSPINPTALNDAFDRVVAQNQQQNLNTQRTITFPVSDPSTTTYNVDTSATQRANRALGFDSNGNITELNLSSTNTVAGNNDKGINLVDSIIEAKVDSVTTTFDVNGNIIVKDSGITAAKLNTDSVTTAKILNDNVTYDKLQDISTSNSVLGNTGTGTVAERALVGDILLDQDTMTSNSAVKGATQQSIKTYVDNKVSTLRPSYIPLTGGSRSLSQAYTTTDFTHTFTISEFSGTGLVTTDITGIVIQAEAGGNGYGELKATLPDGTETTIARGDGQTGNYADKTKTTVTIPINANQTDIVIKASSSGGTAGVSYVIRGAIVVGVVSITLLTSFLYSNNGIPLFDSSLVKVTENNLSLSINNINNKLSSI